MENDSLKSLKLIAERFTGEQFQIKLQSDGLHFTCKEPVSLFTLQKVLFEMGYQATIQFNKKGKQFLLLPF